MAKNKYEGGATGAAQERVPQPGRGTDGASSIGIDKKHLAAMQRSDEKEAAAALRKIKQDIGIQSTLSNPEAMVMTLESVDYDQLSRVHEDLEALAEAYAKRLANETDPDKIAAIENNKANTERVLKTVSEVMHEAVKKDKVYDAQMLGQMLQEKLAEGAASPAESANKALKNLQSEFQKREKEHNQLSSRIEQLTGKDISEVASETGLRRWWRRGQSAYAGAVNAWRGYFGKISGNTPSHYDNAGSLMDRWDSVGVRLNQLEDTISDLSVHEPAKLKEKTGKDLEREMLGEEMVGPEQIAKAEEAPKLSALDRFTRIKWLEKQIAERTGTAEDSDYKARMRLLKYQMGEGLSPAEASEFAMEKELEQLKKEDELDMAARRESSAMEAKKREEAKLSEQWKQSQKEAEAARKAEAAEAAKKEAEAKEAREMQEKIAWSAQILGQGQAFNMTEDILGQYGVRTTKLETTAPDGSKQEYYSAWPNATKEQRDNALAVIFKSAEVQAALPSGDQKEIERLKKELQKLEKATGLRRSPLLEPAGKAGVGVTLESGREESRRTAGRATGEVGGARGRSKARRAENIQPAIEGQLIQEDMGKTAEEAAAEKRRRDQEEAESVDVDLSDLEEETPEMSVDVDLSDLEPKKINLRERLGVKGKKRINPEEVMDLARTQAEQVLSKTLNPAAYRSERLHNKALEIILKPMSKEQALDVLNIPDLGLLNEDLAVRMAKFLEAEQDGAEASIINMLKTYALDKAKESGLESNAKVQEVLLGTRGRKFGKAAGRVSRGAERNEKMRREVRGL